MMFVRSQRWRKALVAACLPYLLLSVFVDYIHLHPLLGGNVPQVSLSEHVKPSQTRDSRLPDSTCVICQWVRAGTGLQPSVASGPMVATLAHDVAPPPVAAVIRPALLTPDFRGPPRALFA